MGSFPRNLNHARNGSGGGRDDDVNDDDDDDDIKW